MQDGSTALIRAAQYGDLELTKILVRHGAQVKYENKVRAERLRLCWRGALFGGCYDRNSGWSDGRL